MLRSPRYEGSDKSRIIAPGHPATSRRRLHKRQLTFKSTSQVNLKSRQVQANSRFKGSSSSLRRHSCKTLFNVSGTTELQSLRPGKPVHFSFRIPTLQRSYETESSRRLCLEARNLFHSQKPVSLWPFTRPQALGPFKNRISFPSREVPFSQLLLISAATKRRSAPSASPSPKKTGERPARLGPLRRTLHRSPSQVP